MCAPFGHFRPRRLSPQYNVQKKKIHLKKKTSLSPIVYHPCVIIIRFFFTEQTARARTSSKDQHPKNQGASSARARPDNSDNQWRLLDFPRELKPKTTKKKKEIRKVNTTIFFSARPKTNKSCFFLFFFLFFERKKTLRKRSCRKKILF